MMTTPSSAGGFTVPALRDPVVLAAFEGWNDAGDAASGALRHLAEAWDAETIAELDGEDYYDYQVNRPIVSLVDGERHIEWPTTTLAVGKPELNWSIELMPVLPVPTIKVVTNGP